MVALRLGCCARVFSSGGAGGAILPCGERASYSSGFSCCTTPAAGVWASALVAWGPWSPGSVNCGTQGLVHTAREGFPDHGLNL